MRILILEDELPAQYQIKKLLNQCFPDFVIAETLTSVISAAEWLKNNKADIIIMDVELSDGICFELFNMVKVDACVLITTAYESYALNAFKVNSIDYLLKPVDKESFIHAIEKCIKYQSKTHLDNDTITKIISTSKVQKHRITVKLGNQILIVNISDIAYFYSENKSTYIVMNDKKELVSDLSIEALEQLLNPEIFFRLSRSCLANISSITSVSKFFNSRLKVKLNPSFKEDIIISRVRVSQFIDWLEGSSAQ